MTSDSGRHAQRGDVQQAPSEGCQSVIAQRIPPMTSSPIGTDQELIARMRLNWDIGLHKEAADALQSRISEVERLREALPVLEEIAHSAWSSVNGDDPIARIRGLARETLESILAALSQQGKV